MLAASFKRTKIVATIGPASSSPEAIAQVMSAGANGLRLNFSHGTHEQHGAVIELARAAAKKSGRPVAIIGDLQGPKIRVGTLPKDGLPMVRGNTVRFQLDSEYDTSGIIPVQHDISKYLTPGERIFLRDGQIEVEVADVKGKVITGKVLSPGLLFTNQGMNLPDTDLRGDIMTKKDIEDVEFMAKSDVDYVALSFVQTADDIKNLRKRLQSLKSDAAIIAKIEMKAAVDNLEDIIAVSDGVMVARGDLAVETMPEAVPAVQRRIIELSKAQQKVVIVATQMLESMIQSPVPTRAEVSDVATAVVEGADAVMLSGESAVGLFPIEAIQMMKRVILYTESHENQLITDRRADFGVKERGNAISAAAITLAKQLPAKVIIAETRSGQTARNIASFRPSVPVVMVTDQQRVYQQLAIVWGGKAFYLDEPKGASEEVMRQLKAAGNVVAGDAVVVASGNQPGVTGGTDTVTIKVI